MRANLFGRSKTRHAHYEDTFRARALGVRAATAAHQIGLFRADRLAHSSAADELRPSPTISV